MKQPCSEDLLLPVAKRLKSFSEVALPWNKKQAMQEAQRCPQCANPQCVQACPLGVNIPAFIRLIREGNFAGALQSIRADNHLTGICGRLCHAPCQTACILNHESHARPIAIRRLERSSFDLGQNPIHDAFTVPVKNKTGRSIAIIGSGATALAAAASLLKYGHEVCILEALHQLGGYLRYGQSEIRLPRKVLEAEIRYIHAMGAKLLPHHLIGQPKTIAELFSDGFHAVLVATGISIDSRMQTDSPHLKGLMSSQELLFRVNSLAQENPFKAQLPELGERVVITGNGFDAMECARILLRLGRKVTFIHKDNEEDLPFLPEEKSQAQQEGLVWESFAQAVEFVPGPSGNVSGVRCVRLDFADHQGVWRLTPVQNSDFIIPAETVILTGSYGANTRIASLVAGLKTNKQGGLLVRKNLCATSLPGVFAAGGAVQGAVALTEVLAQAKKAAEEMNSYLQDLGR